MPVSARLPCLTVSSVILLLTVWDVPSTSSTVNGPASSQDSTKNWVVPLSTWSYSISKPAYVAASSRSRLISFTSTPVMLSMSLSKWAQS